MPGIAILIRDKGKRKQTPVYERICILDWRKELMGEPKKDELYKFCKDIFGERGKADDGTTKQAPTYAIGLIHGQMGVYVVKQGGPINDDTAKKVANAWKEKAWDGNLKDIWSLIDARNLATSQLRKSEWTSFHAEALV